jgi:hypothetical protein
MGNDIIAHRIVIGLFYHKIGIACCRKVKLIVSFDLYDILHWLILYRHLKEENYILYINIYIYMPKKKKKKIYIYMQK